MTDIFYKCDKHGYQQVARILFPDFNFELECGCIYSANLHGNWYRIKTYTCDKCDKPVNCPAGQGLQLGNIVRVD